jgi:hypothetical protein
MDQKIYSKHDFWEKNFKVCMACNETKMTSKDVTLERDPDGRSRGITEFTCKVLHDTKLHTGRLEGRPIKSQPRCRRKKNLHALHHLYT